MKRNAGQIIQPIKQTAKCTPRPGHEEHFILISFEFHLHTTATPKTGEYCRNIDQECSTEQVVSSVIRNTGPAAVVRQTALHVFPSLHGFRMGRHRYKCNKARCNYKQHKRHNKTVNWLWVWNNALRGSYSFIKIFVSGVGQIYISMIKTRGSTHTLWARAVTGISTTRRQPQSSTISPCKDA